MSSSNIVRKPIPSSSTASESYLLRSRTDEHLKNFSLLHHDSVYDLEAGTSRSPRAVHNSIFSSNIGPATVDTSTKIHGGHRERAHTKRGGRWRFRKAAKEQGRRFFDHYNGGTGFSIALGHNYRRPVLNDADAKEDERYNAETKDAPLSYRNQFKDDVKKHHDVAVYLSSTHSEPRRLFVQCTKQVLDEDSAIGDWRRVKLHGSVPLAMRMAEWALHPADPKPSRSNLDKEASSVIGVLNAVGRTILIGPALQLLLALPGMTAPWEYDDDPDDKYERYCGYHWEWPIFAANTFDMRPGLGEVLNNKPQFSSKPRRMRPHTLVVFYEEKQRWEIVHNPSPFIPYVFASFTRRHFQVDTKGQKNQARQKLEQIVRFATRRHFQSFYRSNADRPHQYGYWLDYQCSTQLAAADEDSTDHEESASDEESSTDEESDESLSKTRDINTICDLVRSANQLIIVLPKSPKSQDKEIEAWGESLWTLTEAMLASGDIKFCWPTKHLDLNADMNTADVDAEFPRMQRAQQRSSEKPATIEKFREAVRDYQLQKESSCEMLTLSKLEMSDKFWSSTSEIESPRVDAKNNRNNNQANSWKRAYDDQDDNPARILAEHYSGVLSLSRIELFTTALAALQDRMKGKKVKKYKELTWALMALLHYRIDKRKGESLFQSLARLSLSNDNDDLVERIICWAPRADPADLPRYHRDIFNRYRLSYVDQFGDRLWDIWPMCKLVGLGKEDNTVMIDDCRAINIRWKNFPRTQYKRKYGWKKRIAEFLVRSGSAWIAAAFYTAFYFAPHFASNDDPGIDTSDQADDGGEEPIAALITILIVGLQFSIGLFLSFCGPHCVRRLYGGSVLESTARLIAFEGTLEIKQLERKIFGNYQGRLTYQPSATPLGNRHSDLREGIEPAWVSHPKSEQLTLFKNHKLFTLVDTGRMTVTIFSAEKPPTVALLCGRDGGMLRAVLCSWDFRTDCLYKETIVRMPSEVWEGATIKSWLKLCLDSRPLYK